MPRVGDTALHERMATVEADQRAMRDGIITLNTSLADLGTKIDLVTNKITTAAGVFAAVIFFCEFVLLPVLFIVLKNHF